MTEPLSSNICTFYTQDGIHRPEKYVDGKRCQCGYRPSNEQRTSNHQLNVTLALDAIKHNIILSTAEQKALAAEIERLTRELTTLSTCYAAANTAFRVLNAELSGFMKAATQREAAQSAEIKRLNALVDHMFDVHHCNCEPGKMPAWAFDPALVLNIRNELDLGFHLDSCGLKYNGRRCTCGYNNFGHTS